MWRCTQLKLTCTIGLGAKTPLICKTGPPRPPGSSVPHFSSRSHMSQQGWADPAPRSRPACLPDSKTATERGDGFSGVLHGVFSEPVRRICTNHVWKECRESF